jgi:AraC-like DNA-binding protein
MFRQIHGCTVGEYVRKLRINAACHDLNDSEIPLAEVALTSGFADQSHFSRVFKRQVGMTPGAFRKLARPRKSGSTERSHRPRA